MASCSGIKADGGRCNGQAIAGSQWCFSHHPDYAEQRRRRASKGGKRGGRGRPVAELAALRTENADIRARLLEGGLAPNLAAVAVQSLNTDARLVVAALKVREQEELERRLEELEALVQSQKEQEGGRWGA